MRFKGEKNWSIVILKYSLCFYNFIFLVNPFKVKSLNILPSSFFIRCQDVWFVESAFGQFFTNGNCSIFYHSVCIRLVGTISGGIPTVRIFQVAVWLVIGTGCLSVLVALFGYVAVALESRNLLAWVPSQSEVTLSYMYCLVHDISVGSLCCRIHHWAFILCLSRKVGFRTKGKTHVHM